MMLQYPPSIERNIFDCFEVENTSDIIIEALRRIMVYLYCGIIKKTPPSGSHGQAKGHIVADLCSRAAQVSVEA
ncbi:hypothetical protein GCM10011586_27130 [Silvibacterium dinghuense]|nr:hypothetical protein GCM10011586_27130 [Silvibacterium dinghuense]